MQCELPADHDCRITYLELYFVAGTAKYVHGIAPSHPETATVILPRCVNCKVVCVTMTLLYKSAF